MKDELRENFILLNYFSELEKSKIKDILKDDFEAELADKIAESIRNAYLKNEDRVKLMIRKLSGENLTKEELENACFHKQGRQPKFKMNSDKKSDVKKEEEEAEPAKNNSNESNKKIKEHEKIKKSICLLGGVVQDQIFKLKDEVEEKNKELLEKDSKINSLELLVNELENKLAITNSVNDEYISKEISLKISSFIKSKELDEERKINVEVYVSLLKDASDFLENYDLLI